MEKDTVLLAVEKYNELRDFKRQIEEGKKATLVKYNWGERVDYLFITDAEIEQLYKNRLSELEEMLSREKRQYSELNLKFKDLEKTMPEKPKEISINDLKKMSYWEFRKWRKS